MSLEERFAKIVRIMSAPPIMITVLILILANYRAEVFRSASEEIVLVVLYGLVPMLAYMIQYIIPKYRDAGREGQRKLAFIMTFIGYSLGFIWALAVGVSNVLKTVCFTYFYTAILLILVNKLFDYRASGHAGSATGTLAILIYVFGIKLLIPCVIAFFLVYWSSINLKRHTPKEFFTGAWICLLSFFLSLLIEHSI